jgi:DMSO/TMAO reductase YedYZ molybdopterin-dependent catalytic subunit
LGTEIVVSQVSGDGYTTVIKREDLAESEAFFAIFYQSPDQIIPHEHGGPRLIAPHLFGWKSAKYDALYNICVSMI